MPDFITHLCIAYTITWILRRTRFKAKTKEYYPLFLLGNIIPDLTRPIAYLINFLFPDDSTLGLLLYQIICSMSPTILGVILLSLFLTGLFVNKKWWKIFLPFLLGGLLHLLTDMIMYPWAGMGIQLFAPFLSTRYSFHLVWPDSLLPPLITGLIAITLLLIDATYYDTLLRDYVPTPKDQK